MVHETNKAKLGNSLEKGVNLLVFHAVWCPPCKMLKPVLEEFSEKDNIDVYRVDIDQDKAFAIENQVMSIPTILVYKDGQVLDRLMGYMPYAQLSAKVKELVSK